MGKIQSNPLVNFEENREARSGEKWADNIKGKEVVYAE